MNDFFTQSRKGFRAMHQLEPFDEIPASEGCGLFELARRNRVCGLWARSKTIPDAWSRQIYGQALHSARLTAEAGRIFSALIDSVPSLRLVKGPALAAQAWPEPGLRSFDDLDFRCDKQSLDALVRGLRALGYQPREEQVSHRENLWHFGWGISFEHPDRYLIEVNHRMFPPHYPWPDSLTCYSPDSWGPLDLDGVAVVCPQPALHLLLSCVHGIWHGWERLGWLADVAGLLARYPSAFTDAEALAEGSGFLGRALLCGCGVAVSLFGPLPVDLDPSAEWVQQVQHTVMRSDAGVTPADLRQMHAQLLSSHERAVYTMKRFCIPGDLDFRMWLVPARFRGVYWPLRPLRILLNQVGLGGDR